MWSIPGQRPDTFVYHNWNGFYYHCSFVTRRAIYFKCTKRRCRGRAILYDIQYLHEDLQQNHSRNYSRLGVMQLRLSILESTRLLPSLSFRDIVHREGRRFPLIIRSQVSVDRMRSAMWRVRNQSYPPMPHTLHELAERLQDVAFSFITNTEHAEDNIFSAYVEDGNGNTHIILLSKRMRIVMEQCTWLMADGHFASRPVNPPMCQIFNLATVWSHHGVYLGSVLMESRTTEAYLAVFQTLRQLMPNLNPQYISCDWEPAQQAAWPLAFPNSNIVGCFWHFCRAVIKYAFGLGIGLWIRRSRRFRRLLRMCCILALLPFELMYHGLFEIGLECQRHGWFIYSKFFPLLEYLETEWILSPVRGPRMSVHRCEHRTNNVVESINRYMKKEVGPYHPNTYRMLESVVRLEGIAYSSVVTLSTGGSPARPRSRSALANDANLQALSRDLQQRPLGLRYAIRNFLFYGSNLIRGTYNDLIRHPGWTEAVEKLRHSQSMV